MAKIRGQLKSIWPDRTQYKPYAYNLEMENVWVEVDIPDEECKVNSTTYVTDVEKGAVRQDITETTLTLNGFTCLLSNIADAIDDMHLISLRAKNKTFKQGD